MNRHQHGNTDIELQLDRFIDELNSKQFPSTNGNPELASLAETVRSLHRHRTAEMPKDYFSQQLAARLAARLRQPEPVPTKSRANRQRVDIEPGVEQLNGSFPAGRRNEPPAWQILHPPRQRGDWIKRFGGIAAAIVGFGVLTAILILIFQNDSKQQSAAVGFTQREPHHIAYVSDQDGNAEIFLINDDGTSKTNLTNNPANDTAPAWSPDGRDLAFVSDRSGHNEIYLMDADGSNIRQLTANQGSSTAPTWSPNGQFIAFAREAGGNITAWLMNADGSEPRNIDSVMAANSIDQNFAWSADSSLVAFTYAGSNRGIAISTVTGQTTLIAQAVVLPKFLAWSPDGNWITFNTSFDVMQIMSISAVNIQTVNQPVTATLDESTTAQHFQAVWSPDSAQILFMSSPELDSMTPASQSLSVMAADGSHPRELAASEPDHPFVRARWSTDGEQIAFTRIGTPRNDPARGLTGDTVELVVMNADGSEQQAIDADIWAGFTSAPAWQPEKRSEPLPTAEVTQEKPQIPSPLPTVLPSSISAANAPTLAITPDVISCATPVTINGLNFEPGATVEISPGTTLPNNQFGPFVGSSIVVQADGSFSVELQDGLRTSINDCTGSGPLGRDGAAYTIIASTVVDGAYTAPSASTSFTFQFSPTDPSLSLTPDSAACGSTITLAGHNFEPSTQISLSIFPVGSDSGALLDAHPVVEPDGTFTTELPIDELSFACGSSIPAEHSIDYSINVATGGPGKGAELRAPQASATFTLMTEAATH